MTNATIELYNALVEAGVDKEKAEIAAKSVVSREEVQALATKSDLKAGLSDLRAELYKAMALQTLAIIAGVVGLLQVIG